jgi:NitT/TauT family transport system substrate-binding protein
MVAAIALLVATDRATAAELLRVGKSPGYLFAYTPLDVGIATGIFRAKDIEIEEVSFEGASKMNQGVVVGAIDIALGSPMDMSVMAKGMPARSIAVIAEPMIEFVLLVPFDSPIRSIDDLKGKTIGIATVGSITQWVALELANVKGWGPDGVRTVAIGAGGAAAHAAMGAHLVDATVSTTMVGVVLERQKVARTLTRVADYAPPFIAHTMSATNAIIAAKPDAVRRFVAGWFESVAFMRSHRPETIAITQAVTGFSGADEETEYDRLMPEVTARGDFDSQSIARIAHSFVELGILEKEPDMTRLFTEEFLPRR